MNVSDAELNDIYADENGKLWRVVAICTVPTVSMEEVEGTLDDPNAPLPFIGVGLGQAQQALSALPKTARIVKRQISGGVGGAMWSGFVRIFRKGREK